MAHPNIDQEEQIVEKQEISKPVVEVPVEESNVSTTVEENVEKHWHNSIEILV